jgi:predicted nucleotidyltransferase component of viral defense system
MISKFDLQTRVVEWGLREDVVEKDYVLGWVLWGIGSDETLSLNWIFKGGTCLKKCFIETYRFSEDLDFTITPNGPIRSEEVLPILNSVLERVTEKSGIQFSGRPIFLKTHTSGHYTEGRIYYTGPRNNPSVASIKLDLIASEVVVRPTVLRTIAHSFPDVLPAPANVRCYSFEELFAEKLRAMGERSRPRDLYDIINLFRRRDLRSVPQLIREVLNEKCQSKNVPVPTFASLETSSNRAQLETEWSNMLAHQLPVLPPFEDFWRELPDLFSWLEGTLVEHELEAVPNVDVSEEIEAWSPPATVWVWGQGLPIESIRFAAANHLCVDLGYQGSVRRIEPYALRRSRAGHYLLCAIKLPTRESRSYRIDRIQSITVSQQPFKPVFKIEFSSSGPVSAPFVARTTGALSTGRIAGVRKPSSGLVNIFKCPSCNREFRKHSMDGTLKPHKGRGGWPCPSHFGHFVRATYGH